MPMRSARSARCSCSPHGGTSVRGEPCGCSSSRARVGRGLRRRSSASGAATSPRIMAATEAPPVLTPSPRAFGGRYACFFWTPSPPAAARAAASTDAVSTSSVVTSVKRSLSGASGRHCESYNSSKSMPRTLVPVSACQMLKPLSTRMRGASTAVRKCRPSGAHSELTVQFAAQLETRTKSHFSSWTRPKKSTWPARFPKPARQTSEPKWLKRIVLRCAFSKSTFASVSFLASSS
mmetsp:Transcript_81771/g.210581  ORF Transcript_81771/g.210581 Transcript_81771/m.210581 type:complete len:235 (+) Transcript_81771:361-1065(+)